GCDAEPDATRPQHAAFFRIRGATGHARARNGAGQPQRAGRNPRSHRSQESGRPIKLKRKGTEMMHILQSIAWTLIHFCWQAAVIAGLYAMAARAAEHRTSQFHYVLALSAIFVMLITGIFTFAYETSRGVDAGAQYISAATASRTGDFPR